VRPGLFEHKSCANCDRPELAQTLRALRPGDTLVMACLERLGRPLVHLLQIMEDLGGEGDCISVPGRGVRHATAEGDLMMQRLGAFAEFERKRITARINSGMRLPGSVVSFGNPRLKAGDKQAIKKITLARDEAYVTQLIDTMDTFVPTVLQLRPAKPWPQVAEAVSRVTGVNWTVERLARSVRRLVGEGVVDRRVIGKAPRPRRRRSEELAVLVQGPALTSPGPSLRGVGGKLEAMKSERPPVS
jgi:hypothetical protein